MAVSTANVSISPVNVFWKIEAQEVVDFSNVTASGIGGQYLSFYRADGTGVYAWFDENSLDTDPTPGGGLVAVPVDYAAAATPSAIATAFLTAVGAAAGFDAALVSGSTTQVTVKRTAVGEVSAPGGTATSALVTRVRVGKNVDLGLLQGNIEPSFSPSNLVLTAHQTGVTPLAALNQGFEDISCETVLLETTKSKLAEFFKIYGGVETPGGGTQVIGAGTIANGKNMLVEAARLVFKPVNAVDETQNYNIMLAVPVPSSLTFSGEDPKTLTVTWQGFVDLEFDTKFNAVAIGDVFQTGL
jgi:hypothetical protein